MLPLHSLHLNFALASHSIWLYNYGLFNYFYFLENSFLMTFGIEASFDRFFIVKYPKHIIAIL
jgi:hypothetical protein